MDLFLQQLANGLGAGSVYALWAVGYGFVYQVLGIMNFAHGDVVSLGMYVFVSMLAVGTVGFFPAVLLGGVVAVAIQICIWFLVYRPLVMRDHLISTLIAAIGAAFILRNVVMLGWGPEALTIPPFLELPTIQMWGVRLSMMPFLALTLALMLVVAVQVFLNVSRHGQAIVSISQDRVASSLMGINVGLIIVLVYALSGAIGLAGAVVYASSFSSLQLAFGFLITLKAFIACCIGGFDRLYGVVAGGLLLGLLEAVITSYVSSVFRDAIVLSLLGGLLLFRPQGLFGRREVQKV